MSVVIVTGSAGLIGSESVKFFAEKGFDVVGIDNDMRKYFFGETASTEWNAQILASSIKSYRHERVDIRDADGINSLFSRYGKDIVLVVHAAAQPSHDWAAKEPQTDFGVNAVGTLNLLESTRMNAPDAVFMFTSTNKVYGDTPNRLPLVEKETRWELDPSHSFAEHGIDETMSIDHTLHSVFGASKVAADVMVQEYGKYFGMKTGCLRGGCLTGPAHSGAQLHGFLSYLVKCAVQDIPYSVFGYKAKQVRDNIHSHDLVSAIWEFFKAPRPGEAYNMGGSRYANVSMLEAIAACEKLTGRPMRWTYVDQPRIGDHIWWVSDTRKFANHFPEWRQQYDLERTVREIYETAAERPAA